MYSPFLVEEWSVDQCSQVEELDVEFDIEISIK